jgi:protein farnesyltransferase subunit beta
LRDKPSKFPDSYHTCYVLVGLSAAQNIFSYCEVNRLGVVGATAGFGWKVEGGSESVLCEEIDRVRAVHPIFVVSFEGVKEARGFFEWKGGF